MDAKECIKKTEEIYETINCWISLEHEVLKLFCLFSKCATHKYEGQELINVNYIREKIFNLLIKHPTILDQSAKRLFCEMKIERDMGKLD